MRALARTLFGLLFVAAGAGHFRAPGVYVKIMPPVLPAPLTLVYLSGVAEIALGVLLLVPRTRRPAAWGLIALLVAVFPANVHMAANADQFPQFQAAALWARLPLQGLLILWAWAYTREGAAAGRG